MVNGDKNNLPFIYIPSIVKTVPVQKVKSVSKIFISALLLIGGEIHAQTVLPAPANIEAAYVKGTRTFTGGPGRNYWQNQADYDIDVNFNPESRLLSGTVSIAYTNNSPDTLRQIEFKLYPNLYKKGVIRNMPVLARDLTDGVDISKLSINHIEQDSSDWVIDGTNMMVKTPDILPGQSVHFDISYSYTLNKTSHIRTGEVDRGAFFIAYFFPRVAVYDDIDGWNLQPYTGIQEFYNDFCNFHVRITVPGDYEVWATGNLTNADSVLSDRIHKRLLEAGRTDTVTDIITAKDLKAGNITQNATSNTWKFDAHNVTDFAFAISNHYLWKASSLAVDPATGRRTRVDAVFNPDHRDYYDVINYARITVKAMSYQFPGWPYPYPHETVFDGLDQMEYPMMVNDNPLQNKADCVELTDHEIFHTMFPFYMGTNETKYAWMDEGWATIGEWVISSVIDPDVTDTFAIGDYEHIAGTDNDLPDMTPSIYLTGKAYESDSYPKPGLGYLYVRDMLGDSVFTKALHYYISQWHGKHPMPYDFFNCMNTGSGENLDWFWKRWFFDSGVPDLAISSVKKIQNQYTVIITSIGSKPVPVDLTIYYTSGDTSHIHRSVACWKDGNKTVAIRFRPKRRLKKIELGNDYDADTDKRNNRWRAR